MTKILIERAVMEQALEALDISLQMVLPKQQSDKARRAAYALRATLAEPVHPAIPLENSREAADAIEATLAEYGHPINPVNAARAGWRAARLYATPPQPAEPVAEARAKSPAQPMQERNNAPVKLPVPHEWHTELATTCFARGYSGEGSYYCPHCDINVGSVWREYAWRPTKWQAICHKCRELFEEQA